MARVLKQNLNISTFDFFLTWMRLSLRPCYYCARVHSLMLRIDCAFCSNYCSCRLPDRRRSKNSRLQWSIIITGAADTPTVNVRCRFAQYLYRIRRLWTGWCTMWGTNYKIARYTHTHYYTWTCGLATAWDWDNPSLLPHIQCWNLV